MLNKFKRQAVNKFHLDLKKLDAILKLNYIAFPYLWVFTFLVAILESFTYSGYSLRHLYLPLQLLIVLCMVLGILSRLNDVQYGGVQKIRSAYKMMFTFNNLMIIPIISSYLLVISLDAQNYNNYVFSTIHLQPQLYLRPVLLSVYLFFINIRISNNELLIRKMFLFDKSKKTMLKNIKDIFLKIVIFVFATNLLVKNIPIITVHMVKGLSYLIPNLNATYEDKMVYTWGDFYKYLMFVKENTPESSVIAFPPMMNPWNDVGNGGLIRYFLYPRKIVQDMTNKDTVSGLSNADYVMLAWGFGDCQTDDADCHGWPRIEIPADYVLYMKNKNSNSISKVDNIIYNPMDSINSGAWGIIKVNK